LKLINSKGEAVMQQDLSIRIEPFAKKTVPCMVQLPDEKGGYLFVAEFYQERKNQPVISRRYLKIGDRRDEQYEFYEMKP